jgi:hypothetical protein
MKRATIAGLGTVSLVVIVSGCGGGSSTSVPAALSKLTSSTTESGTVAAAPETGSVRQKLGAARAELGSPSQVPRSKGGDNSIQDYGQEASTADRAAAAAVLVTYLHAYAGGDAQTACSLLSSSAAQVLGRLTGAATPSRQRGAACSGILRRLSAEMPAPARGQLAGVRLLSLRVGEGRAFAIYTDAGPGASFMPMVKQGADWKVNAIAGSLLPGIGPTG